ncbi:MAG: efflux RND transporter periplasmic adaptor subunit [Burkholderiaceae bacterium]|nr:efflux RND transporter periplasmic adaptor subunit [Burkholderiaceae bacterium]
MRRGRGVVAVVALAALGAAALLFMVRGREVDIVVVQRAPIVQSVVATGRIATPARIEVSSQLAARIERIEVREGDVVSAGALLVQLRSDEAEAALAAARAALREAEGRQRQLVGVQRPVAEQQLVQAQANLRLAEQELVRARDLVARGFVAQARVDDAVRSAATAGAVLEAAQAQARANREDGAEAELARIRIEQARANVATASARLDLLALRAPADAVVLTREAEPGDTAQAGRPVLTLAQQGETRIIAAVDEKNLRHLKPGQHASALADAFPASPFEAELYYVAPSVDAQRGTVEVRLRVARPPAFVKPEMTVSVEMVVGRRESALVLPADAIRTPGPPGPDTGTGTGAAGTVAGGADAIAGGAGVQAEVLVVRDGRAERVPVVLGLRGIGTVEVAQGLAEGDAVILPSSPAQVGERVRERTVRAKANLQSVPPMSR